MKRQSLGPCPPTAPPPSLPSFLSLSLASSPLSISLYLSICLSLARSLALCLYHLLSFFCTRPLRTVSPPLPLAGRTVQSSERGLGRLGAGSGDRRDDAEAAAAGGGGAAGAGALLPRVGQSVSARARGAGCVAGAAADPPPLPARRELPAPRWCGSVSYGRGSMLGEGCWKAFEPVAI